MSIKKKFNERTLLWRGSNIIIIIIIKGARFLGDDESSFKTSYAGNILYFNNIIIIMTKYSELGQL